MYVHFCMQWGVQRASCLFTAKVPTQSSTKGCTSPAASWWMSRQSILMLVLFLCVCVQREIFDSARLCQLHLYVVHPYMHLDLGWTCFPGATNYWIYIQVSLIIMMKNLNLYNTLHCPKCLSECKDNQVQSPLMTQIWGRTDRIKRHNIIDVFKFILKQQFKLVDC